MDELDKQELRRTPSEGDATTIKECLFFLVLFIILKALGLL